MQPWIFWRRLWRRYLAVDRENNLQGRDFLSLQDFSAVEIRVLLDLAKDLKSRLKKGELQPLLAGKTLAMIFEKPSTRTRISFEVGMWQLGGAALFLSSQELQMGRGEPVPT
jgi:ornithine carbamoyltransferase